MAVSMHFAIDFNPPYLAIMGWKEMVLLCKKKTPPILYIHENYTNQVSFQKLDPEHSE